MTDAVSEPRSSLTSTDSPAPTDTPATSPEDPDTSSSPATTSAPSTSSPSGTSTVSAPSTASRPGTLSPQQDGSVDATHVTPDTATGRKAPITTPRTGGSSLVFGGVGDVGSMSAAAGSRVANHDYGHLQDGHVAVGEMITINAQGLPWSSVANAAPGSALYNDMVRWAKAIKARPGTIEVAFGHEPEQAAKRTLGTPAQYQAAYRKVVTVFRSQGVTNVRWVFQATSWGFLAQSTASNYAPKYYPGDAYVDVIGADGYNWGTCGQGNGVNRPMSEIFQGALAFAKSHGKQLSLPEFGADKTIARDVWMRDGFAWMKANRATLSSAYYFNRPTTNTSNTDCSWPLTRTAEYNQVRAIVADAWTSP